MAATAGLTCGNSPRCAPQPRLSFLHVLLFLAATPIETSERAEPLARPGRAQQLGPALNAKTLAMTPTTATESI